MILPSAVMDGVFEYFDAADLARLAQVNKAWRSIVYRKSVWANKYWTLKHEYGVVLEKIPRDARHVGKPNALCFITWLFKTFEFNNELTLPIYLLHSTDSAKFIKNAHAYWSKCRCPCVIMDHHEPTDLLIMRFPKSMDLSDRKRILARIIKPSTRTLHRSAHEYSRYIQHMLYSSRESICSTTLIHTPNPDDKDAADPLRRYRYDARRIQSDRFEAVVAYKERVYAAYTASITALRTHGICEFDINDAAFEKSRDLAWTHAAFGLSA
jgi:hypothetical protein